MADWIANTPDAWIIPADVRERAEAKRREIDAYRAQQAEQAEAALPWQRRLREWLEAERREPDNDGWITISAPREEA